MHVHSGRSVEVKICERGLSACQFIILNEINWSACQPDLEINV